MNETRLAVRAFLLVEVLRFVELASRLPGVRRIALVGSLAGEAIEATGAAVLVSVDAGADLAPLAAAGRKLKGMAQRRNQGAEVFLADAAGRYIGRSCRWRACGPGIHGTCTARHCGSRHFLNDDLDVVDLDPGLVIAPPLELWPQVVRRAAAPVDVELYLLRPLEARSSGR